MAWSERTSSSGVYYGEGNDSSYWDWLNSSTAFDLCMPNCTVYARGRQFEAGRPDPITRMPNANQWHTVVNTANNWELLDYTQGMALQAGDILEWVSPQNHVAVCETSGSDPTISGSWYTDRSSSLVGGSTIADVSNYFKTHNTYRFWHNNRKIYTEAGASSSVWPTYVIRYTGEEPGPTPPPTPTYDDVNIAIYATINKRRNKRNAKIIL